MKCMDMFIIIILDTCSMPIIITWYNTNKYYNNLVKMTWASSRHPSTLSQELVLESLTVLEFPSANHSHGCLHLNMIVSIHENVLELAQPHPTQLLPTPTRQKRLSMNQRSYPLLSSSGQS